MPLSSKLKADYIELINVQLDTIRVYSIEDFDLVQQALDSILQRQPITYKVPEKYKEKIFYINDYLSSPEDYVQNSSDYEEYKQIIKTRITAKITEFQSLSNIQKEAYIQNQHNISSQATVTQGILAQHLPPQPGSDRHVLSEEQWQMQMQMQMHLQTQRQTQNNIRARIPQVANQINQQQSPAQRARSIELLIQHGHATNTTLAEINPNILNQITKLECIQAIRDGVFSLEDVKDINPHTLSQIIKPQCIAAIRDGRTTLGQLTIMEHHDLIQANNTNNYPIPPQLGI